MLFIEFFAAVVSPHKYSASLWSFSGLINSLKASFSFHLALFSILDLSTSVKAKNHDVYGRIRGKKHYLKPADNSVEKPQNFEMAGFERPRLEGKRCSACVKLAYDCLPGEAPCRNT